MQNMRRFMIRERIAPQFYACFDFTKNQNQKVGTSENFNELWPRVDYPKWRME